MATDAKKKTTSKSPKGAQAATVSGAPCVKITLVRSLIGRPEAQRKVVKALGLKRTHSSVQVADSPIIRGMIQKVSHLITVESLA